MDVRDFAIKLGIRGRMAASAGTRARGGPVLLKLGCRMRAEAVRKLAEPGALSG